jgi:hypothetical protein
MKVDLRDACWLVITLVLLGLLGMEWRKASLIAIEIRAISAAEAPLELVNSNVENAAMYISQRYNVRMELDWPSLKTVGIDHPTKVSRTIRADSGKEALEQLFGDKVEVVEQLESTQILGRPVFRIQARSPVK